MGDGDGEQRLQVLLGRLDGAKRSRGNTYSARCPVATHGDRKASLAVSLGEIGEPIAHCHKGCTEAAIFEAVGLGKFLEFRRRPGSERKPMRQHDYEDADGRVIAIKLRWSGRGAKFSWRRPDGSPGLGGVDPGLYRRPAVDAATRERQPVWVAEGEHDADVLATLGYPATTGTHGAGTWRPAWTAVLAGSAVLVVADRDERGIAHARRVGAELAAAGCTVTLLVPPRPYKDIAELIDAGGSVTDLDSLEPDLDLTAETYITRDGRPAFAMIPDSWARSFDPWCIALLVRLDMEQAFTRKPMAGRNKLVRLLGWSREVVDLHLRHLEHARIVVIERRGQRQSIYRVLNPSRRPAGTATSGPPARPPADRQTVQSNRDSGPPARPLDQLCSLQNSLSSGETKDLEASAVKRPATP